jgi:hemoglobin
VVVGLYHKLGAEKGIRLLVERFYELMDQTPEAATIRAMHPEDLGESIDKLFEFLSGWSGGPQLYVSKYGHPRLRMRHMPFEIGIAERDQWLLCMKRAISEQGYAPEVCSFLEDKFSQIADFMRNQPGDQ